MNNKGFSLIELLAVIIVLAALLTILIPSVQNYLEDSKDDVYKQNVAEIEKAATEWNVAYGNTVTFDLNNDTGEKTYILTLKELKKSEFMSDEPIYNPLENNEVEMDGCVLITLSTKDIYTYKYYEGCVIDEE